MLRTTQTITLGAAITGLLATMSWPALAAPPADWSQIPTKTVTLFYPGQGGYQWLRSRDHKRADKKVKRGEGVSFAWHKETYFGGLYQKVVARRLASGTGGRGGVHDPRLARVVDQR